MVAFARRSFVHAQLGDGGRVVRRPRLADPMGEHGPDALRVDPHDLGHPVDRHLALDQGQCQCLEQQREAAAGARPGHRHRGHLAVGCLDARHGAMEVAGVLEEAQVLPPPFHRVMDRTGRPEPVGKPGTRWKADHDVQFLAPGFVRGKGDFLDLPG